MKTPNILLIVLDTARADYIQEMRRSGDLPAIEQFAAVGTTYTNAFTTSPWTLPSHASMFSGERSSDHGTHSGNRYFEPDFPSLAELLSKEGYRTLGISGNSWVSSEFGFDVGFDNLSMKWDRFWNSEDLSSISRADGTERFRELAKLLLNKRAPVSIANAFHAKFLGNRDDFGAAQTTDRTVDWLEASGKTKPFFYFINYLEPHLPYEPPEPYRSRYVKNDLEANQDPWSYIAGDKQMTAEEFEKLRNLYRAELAYLDHHLERLYETLDETGQLESTAVVIVGDHGENIGEHGLMDHQYSLHETLLHVPLIIHYPGQSEHEVVDDLVEVRDIFPTIISLAGAKRPNEDSISSVDLFAGESRDAVFAEYRHPQPHMESLEENVEDLQNDYERLDQTIRSVRTSEWKLIEYENGDAQLYAAGAETDELTATNEATIGKLRRSMDEHGIVLFRGEKRDLRMSERSKQRLEDLGYI